MFKILPLVANCSIDKRSFVNCKEVLMSSLHVTSCAIVERAVILRDSVAFHSCIGLVVCKKVLYWINLKRLNYFL